jgi:N-succinyldiaminopimelate aminotransferase
MKPANTVLSRYGETIFATMSALAQQHDAINLGQGFPEGCEPREIVEHAAKALLEESNQYPSMMGLPALRQAVAAHDRDFYGLDIDWKTETLVVSGGTEALGASLLALIDPGDEVVLIEPVYDTYLPIVELAGGVPKIVRLSPPEWRLPLDELAAAFSDKTKLILFNSPMNPTAKVFSRVELEAIAALVTKYDAYAICDEVYEHLVFDGDEHIR